MQPPHIHQLHSNYAPTDDELKQITQLLVEPIAERNDLDVRISKLKVKRDQLQDVITPHLALLSPIRRIPQDVLREIFVRCLPTTYNSIMARRQPPLLLGRVCSSWRIISRTTPKLWSSIHIAIPDSFYVVNLTAIVADWLNMSGALPLSITVYQSELHGHRVERDLFPYLISLSKRWKHIHLSLHPIEFPPIAALSAEDVPLLESLSIELHKVEGRRLQLTKPCGIFQAPRLRGLSICASLVFTVTLISWSKLSELIITKTGTRLDMDVAFAILKCCRNLTSCSLEFRFSDVPPQPQSDPVILPLLKTLSITGDNSLGPFLDNLHLPKLLNLKFTFKAHSRSDDGTDEFNCSQFHAFLRRLTTLDSLTLTASPIRREFLINCIIEVPCITQLCLSVYGDSNGDHHYPVDDHILVLLTATDTKEVLCPLLKVVKCDYSSVSDDVLLSFIRSRTILPPIYGVAKLECVEFRLPREQGDDIFFVPPEVISEGTEVLVTYHIPYVPLKYLRSSYGAVKHLKLSRRT